MRFHFCLLLVSVSVSLIECQKTKKSGEEIADSLYKHQKECKDPNDGGIWAPLAPGHSCGTPGHDCKYPDQWCSARASTRSVPQLNCVNLSDDCKKALKEEDANKTTTSKTSISPNTTIIVTSTTTEKIATTQKQRTTTEATTAIESAEATTVADVSSEEVETTRRPTRKPNKGPAKARHRNPNESDETAGASAAEVRPPALAPAPAPPPAPDCKDDHQLCCFWANNLQPLGSECDRNALWMRTTCQKSCGTCGCKASNYQTCQVKVNVEGCRFLQGSPNFVLVPVANRGQGPFNFPTAGGNPGPVVVPLGGGVGGAGAGFGVPNQGNSPVVVPLGGGNGALNQGFGGGQPSPVVVSLTGRNCFDAFPNCGLWAQAGQCSTNSQFMLSFCRRSCGAC